MGPASLASKVAGSIIPGRGTDDYKPIRMDEEGAESRVSLSTPNRYRDNRSPDDEATVGLLEDEYSGSEKVGLTEPRKSRWGFNWLTWFIILGGISAIVLVFVVAWGLTHPKVDNIKGLPEFGTSLGCLAAPFLYNDTRTHVFDAPMQPVKFDHGIDIRGDGVGTITLASASKDSSNIHYEVSISSTDNSFVQASQIKVPNPPPSQGNAGGLYSSVTTITTPYFKRDHPEACVRFDVKLYVPPSLKKLHLASHALAHIKYEKGADIKLDDLFVTLYGLDKNNMIQTSKDVRSNHLSLEVTQGWIAGDVSLMDGATIMTQRGDGRMHVHVYPEPPRSKDAPETATLHTTTGAGVTKVFFHQNKGVKRPIASTHVSSRNGPVALNYQDAGFSGLVNLQAGSSKTLGLEKLDNPEQDGEWTHFAGDKDGEDRIATNSRGWVSLLI
ncbi:hypothetical protein AGABI2DRAFT_192314 [Agaricus bisporus var. bisporus H97]|uniref:hypothetical protein n=1 Tax=Agaricus bisporus var. bisporus (strain H97 / ATCC MYA-4626 / FGSC 10389) TaxID=936046 RepID=UPI00029F728A|nr:hypothetical protein AGABI2DRAFT_192314 [Agaricus bisporus var. bisporus H97]EKV47045.1 hypothetical protein AGABI2DRAFT_192314 [Agaricus bisporus var. bisporus H97]